MTQINKSENNNGVWVLLCFVAFFGVVVAVNVVFITMALGTHSGVITQKPYEKGLAYNKMLEMARAQPALQSHVTVKDDMLRVHLMDTQGEPVIAEVSATVVRLVKSGDDFTVALTPVDDGIYEAALAVPHAGEWSAQVKAVWNTAQYQTRHIFVVK